MMDEKTMTAEAEDTTTPATPAKRGPGRPRKLQSVAAATPEDNRQAEWSKLELEARAERLGVSAESLAPSAPPVENWRERLPQAKPAANPAWAGLYHLNGGNVCMSDGIALVGSNVRLSAEDGRHISVRGIGVRVAD